MNYALLVALSATLFIRPSEVTEVLSTIPVYNILIILCIVSSQRSLLQMFNNDWIRKQPTSLCIFGLIPLIFASDLFRISLTETLTITIDFIKITIYYLLLIVTLNTSTRLTGFLRWQTVFTLILASIALLHYYQYISIQSLQLAHRSDGAEGEELFQLQATGIFSDPNDFCSILVVSIMIATFFLTDRRGGFLRLLWIIPISIFGWALMLTHSRGGFLGLLMAIATILTAQLGWRRAILACGVALPGLFFLVGGRQTRISLGEDTSLGRMEFWFEGFRLLARSPLFGVGAGQFVEHVGAVAHNSFVQKSSELGVVGGMLFLGVFFFPLWSLHRLSPQWTMIIDLKMRNLRSFLMAIVVGYMVSLMSISRDSTITTYIIPGLVVSYLNTVETMPANTIPSSNFRSMLFLALVYVGLLSCLLVLVRFYVH